MSWTLHQNELQKCLHLNKANVDSSVIVQTRLKVYVLIQNENLDLIILVVKQSTFLAKEVAVVNDKIKRKKSCDMIYNSLTFERPKYIAVCLL